jgi:hypothetical protein
MKLVEVGVERANGKAPNPKHQDPGKFQVPNSKDFKGRILLCPHTQLLELGLSN